MSPRVFKVGLEDKGKRLDVFLVEALGAGTSRGFAQKLIGQGSVRVNGKRVKASEKLLEGQSVEVELPPAAGSALVPEPMPLAVVYEDDEIIVIDKPAGLVVHPAPGHATGTLVHALLAHCGNLAPQGAPLRPGIVHRLDRGTSGLLVAAKTARAYQSLVSQFEKREVEKTYVAVVRGALAQDAGTIELPIGRHPRHREKMAVRLVGAREARTSYRVLRRGSFASALEIKIATGRTHQIRVHLAFLGHPVLGDAQYGTGRDFPRLALHARRLAFRHPATGERLAFSSPLPPEMENFLIQKKPVC